MLSLSTLGYVCGLESLSSPTAVISFPESESYAPLIQATFVNILSLSVSGLAVTSHVNSNVSLTKELVVYAFNALDVAQQKVLLSSKLLTEEQKEKLIQNLQKYRESKKK